MRSFAPAVLTFCLFIAAFSGHVSAAPSGKGYILQINAKDSTGVLKTFEGAAVADKEKLVVVRDTGPAVDDKTGKARPGREEVTGVVEVLAKQDGGLASIKILQGARNIAPGDKVRRTAAPPSGLSGSAIGYRNNRLAWSESPEPEVKEYRVYRADSADGPFKVIGNKKRGETEYIDEHSVFNPLEDSRSYYYRVTAVNIIDVESDPSRIIKVTTMGPPAPPEGFAGESGLIRSVRLSWKPSEDKDVSGYRIYRSRAPRGPFTLVKEIKRRGKAEYHDYGDGTQNSPKLDDAVKYFYAISALSPYGDEGRKSAPVPVTTAPPPDPPEGLTADSWRPRKVPLSWMAHEDENVRGYLIYRAKEKKGPYAQIADISGRDKTSYVDGETVGIFGSSGGLDDFTVYHYKIQAYNWAGSRSELSEPVSVTTKPRPMAPENVETTSNRPKQVPITWRKSPEAGLVKYRIFRSESEIGEFKMIGEVPADKNYYLDEGLESDKTYYYKIQAVDQFGMEGEFSEAVSATTKKRPSPVRGLRWEMEGSNVVLKWSPNKEVDITQYLIYTKGFFGWKQTGSTRETFYILSGFGPGGRDDFAVSAVDADGLEGDKSGVLTIDLR